MNTADQILDKYSDVLTSYFIGSLLGGYDKLHGRLYFDLSDNSLCAKYYASDDNVDKRDDGSLIVIDSHHDFRMDFAEGEEESLADNLDNYGYGEFYFGVKDKIDEILAQNKN